MEFAPPVVSIRLGRNDAMPIRKSEMLVVVKKRGNARGAKEHYFKQVFKERSTF